MGMVVRTNMMAMNANRSLGVNNSNVGKSLEKLSSGFRINRAADDASGLAISEKMKSQIKGLEQASSNSQDGISLIQTAEGATQEIHNMLNRMTELATKSANGTVADEVDREAIQSEITDLNAEISRISKATNFNGTNLLDGSMSAASAAVDITADVTGVLNGVEVVAGTPPTIVDADLKEGDKLTVNGTTYTYVKDADGTSNTFGSGAALVEALKLNGVTGLADGSKFEIDAKTGKELNLQIGDTNDGFNHVSVSIDDLSAKGLGINGLDVSSQAAAGNAIETIKSAINQVSTNRANLGSLQNRLEYTINNLDTTAENMTAANSRIRDTDMAKEMMNYTKNNILTQAAQSMLAQANQAPQAILQLLQ